MCHSELVVQVGGFKHTGMQGPLSVHTVEGIAIVVSGRSTAAYHPLPVIEQSATTHQPICVHSLLNSCKASSCAGVIQAFQRTAGDAKGPVRYASKTAILQPAAAALHGINSTAQRDPRCKPADQHEN